MANSRRDEIIIHGDRKGDKEESAGSQRGDHFVKFEQRRDGEVAQSPNVRAEFVTQTTSAESFKAWKSYLA